MSKRKRILKYIPLLICNLFLLGGCTQAAAREDDLIMYLPFDEGKGTSITDMSGNLPIAELDYNLSHYANSPARDPEWRSEGIRKGCLLFDGSSNYITYNKRDLTIDNSELTISVFVAPRTFEWDVPGAERNETDSPTGIISQTDQKNKAGFILGYGKYGSLVFRVGTGKEWLSIHTNGDNLEKYKWNHVVATFSESQGEMRLYLNGTLVSSRSVPAGTSIKGAEKKSLVVGRNNEAERLTAGFIKVFSGYMDELKLYGRALTEKEVSDIYSSANIPEIRFEDIYLQNILTEDTTRTQYHAQPYQFWMNEPHAPMYYNGMYHLFYQQNMAGSYWRNICWGHFVSEDMVHWTPIKEAIVPIEDSIVPDGVWSGGAAYDKNGVPLLFFTAGNDSFSNDGLISNQNIGVAYPADPSDKNLTEWKVVNALAIEQKAGQGRRGEFRDPSIYYKDGTWYMFICSGSTTQKGGSVLVYTTDKLELLPTGNVDMNWKYRGICYEMKQQSTVYGTSWELPCVCRVTNESGTIAKYFLIISPAPASIADNKIYYFLGDFDEKTCRFIPDEGYEVPKLLDYGANVFTGPSVFNDPVSGETVIFSIMQDQRSAAEEGLSGWAHCAGLPRKLFLSEDGSELCIAPASSTEKLKGEVLAYATGITVEEANEMVKNIHEDMYYLKVRFGNLSDKEVGISLKSGEKRDNTLYSYDPVKELLYGETSNPGKGASTSYVSGHLANMNNCWEAEIFTDRSLIEGFFNNDKAISIRAYCESPTSDGISFFGDKNTVIEELTIKKIIN